MRDWFILALYTIWYVVSLGCFRRNVIEPIDFLNRKEISKREAENALRDFYREKSLARQRLLKTWEEDYIREATGNTIQGVVEYVLSGDTVRTDFLKQVLGLYSKVEYSYTRNYVRIPYPGGRSFDDASPEQIIENFITVNGTSNWSNDGKPTQLFYAGTITADKITTSRPLYTHSDL